MKPGSIEQRIYDCLGREFDRGESRWDGLCADELAKALGESIEEINKALLALEAAGVAENEEMSMDTPWVLSKPALSRWRGIDAPGTGAVQVAGGTFHGQVNIAGHDVHVSHATFVEDLKNEIRQADLQHHEKKSLLSRIDALFGHPAVLEGLRHLFEHSAK